jgi:hypothetical protein
LFFGVGSFRAILIVTIRRRSCSEHMRKLASVTSLWGTRSSERAKPPAPPSHPSRILRDSFMAKPHLNCTSNIATTRKFVNRKRKNFQKNAILVPPITYRGVAKSREKSKKDLTFTLPRGIFLAKTVPISALPSESPVSD